MFYCGRALITLELERLGTYPFLRNSNINGQHHAAAWE